MPNAFTHGYALLVGVGESAYPALSLPVTVKDIQAIRAILTDPNLCAYPGDDRHIRLNHDKTATRAAILDGLAWLKAQAAADPEAIAVVFYSGHGWLDESTGRYYLIPHDVEPFNVAHSALPAQEFTDALREIKAKRLLVMIDCCHAEGMAAAKKGPAAIKLPPGLVQTAPPKGLVEQLKQGEGRAVFTSSRGQQLSWIRPDGSLSVYTHHLVEALQGAGNKPGDTVVHLSNLMNHLGKAVPESARTLHQAEQVPFFDTAAEDFAVAMLRGGKGLPQEGWEGVKQEAAETIRLYDKRIKVYYGLMELIAAVVQEGNVGPRQLVKFCAETNESDFLFGPEIPIYLREVYSKAVEVRAQMTKLDGNDLPVGPERSKVAAQNSASLTWFNDQFEVAKAKFSPYLAFRNVK